MKRQVTSLVLAAVSVIAGPILVSLEMGALLFASMVTYEPTNSLVVKVLSVAVVMVIGILALAVPVIALVVGISARRASRATSTGGGGMATAAVVIASIVILGVLIAQAYMVAMAVGSCSLDGC